MKFFNTSQIKSLDQYTIEHEPITSIDLMERAADVLYDNYLSTFSYNQPICIVAGPGNNGGDALALARMFLHTSLDVKVVLIHTGKLSTDCKTNRQRLIKKFPGSITELTNEFVAPEVSSSTILIDGLFGSGLTRPLNGIFADAVNWMNHSGCKVFAIDIPSGLQGEENPDLNVPIVKANNTFSLQFPKLAFLLPENAEFVGRWKVLDIGILPKAISETESHFTLLENSDIQLILKDRPKFSHKGTFGHALILAGSKGMAGASVMSAKATIRSGAGLVTVHGPEANRIIVQTAVPEVIYHSDNTSDYITELPSLHPYNAIAIGPGIGTSAETAKMLETFLKQQENSCILDADALNIIGQHPHLLELIPNESILTPHPKEFERLFGTCRKSFDRMNKASEAARKFNIIIILKGAHSLIATPNGNLYFNSTGNAGMATAGTGDVLTGILAGLLAQGYSPEETAKTGVFLHGLAGDLALKNESEESLIAGDLIANLGKAFESVRNQQPASGRTD